MTTPSPSPPAARRTLRAAERAGLQAAALALALATAAAAAGELADARAVTVLDAAGRPVSGALVRVGEVERTTDGEGRTRVPPGPLVVEAEGHARHEGPFAARIRLEREAVVRLRVVAADTLRPVVGAAVRERGGAGRMLATDARGRTRLDQRPGGCVDLALEAGGFLEAAARACPARSETVDLLVRLEPSVDLLVDVTREGRAVAAAGMTAFWEGADLRAGARDDPRRPPLRTRALGGGRFVVPGIPARRSEAVILVAWDDHGRWRPEAIGPDAEAGPGGALLAAIDLRPGGLLRVRAVVAPEAAAGAESEPVAVEAAELTLQVGFVHRRGHAVLELAPTCEAAASALSARPVEEQGTELVVGPLPAGSWRIAARAGDLTGEVTARPEPPGVRGVTVALRRLPRLRGTVVDDRGAPLPGATVSCPAGGTVPAREDGSFSIGCSLRSSLHFEAEGHLGRSLRATRLPEDGVVELVRPARLLGRVVDAGDGSPLPGASLRPARWAEDLGRLAPRRGEPSTADESAEFDVHVPPGTWAIVVNAPGHLEAVGPVVEALPGEAVRVGEIEVSAGATLRGRAVDAVTGRGRPGVAVAVEGAAGAAVSEWDGSFVLEGVPPGEQVVVARLPVDGGSEARRRVTVVPGEDPEPLLLAVGESAVLEGTASRADGTPHVGVFVQVTAGARSFRKEADEEGRFRIEGLPAGPALVGLMGLPGTVQTVTLDPGRTTVTELRPRSCRVTGRFLVDGRPARGELIVQRRHEVVQGRASEGRYVIEALPPGSWTVLVAGEGESLDPVVESIPLEVPEGALELVRDIVIETGARGRLTGRVIDAETGLPVENGLVFALQDGRELADLSTAPGGRFDLQLADGSYLIQAALQEEPPGWIGEPVEVSVVDGVARPDDVELSLGRRTDRSLVLVDEVGRPLSGASVIPLEDTFLAGLLPLNELFGGARTDPEGRVRVAQPAPHGVLFVRAGGRGFAFVTLPARSADEPTVVRLLPWGRLVVRGVHAPRLVERMSGAGWWLDLSLPLGGAVERTGDGVVIPGIGPGAYELVDGDVSVPVAVEPGATSAVDWPR